MEAKGLSQDSIKKRRLALQWSEKQEVEIETEILQLAEDSSEGKQVKNRQEEILDESQLLLLFLTHILQMSRAWGGETQASLMGL